MKVSIKNEIFIIGSLPIGPNGIQGNRKEYMHIYQHPPEIIRLGVRAHKRLMQLASPHGPIPLDYVMGMEVEVEVDGNLDKDEWRIGRSEEIIYDR